MTERELLEENAKQQKADSAAAKDLLTYVDKLEQENTKLRKSVEQLKTHLDTYAECIGEKQQENAELRERVAELEFAVRGAICVIKQQDKN